MTMGLELQVEWRNALRAYRERRAMSRPALALSAGVSPSAIKAFEAGSRRPSRDVLVRVVEALQLTRDEANPLFIGAGHSVDWDSLFGGRWSAGPEWLEAAVQQVPWPVFVTGQGINLVCANRAFEAVWDVDLSTEFPDPGQRNFLAGASVERFASCAENYDELLRFMLGLMKGDPRRKQDLEDPASWMTPGLEGFLRGNPKFVRHLLDAWETAQPIPHYTRHQYEVRWVWRGEQRLRFLGILSIADIWNELSWNDWVPADAETWETLNQILKAPRPAGLVAGKRVPD